MQFPVVIRKENILLFSSSSFPHVVGKQHKDDVCPSLLSHHVPSTDMVSIVDSKDNLICRGIIPAKEILPVLFVVHARNRRQFEYVDHC